MFPGLKDKYIKIYKATCDTESGPIDGIVPVPDTSPTRGYRASANLQSLDYADVLSTSFYYIAEPTDNPTTYLYKV